MRTLQSTRPEPLEARERRPSVLFVDDEASVLSSFRRSLRQEPYELSFTSMPLQAVEWARRREFDVVIADQRMPLMTGVELLQSIRFSSPRTMRVLLTAYPNTPEVEGGNQ